LSIELVFFLGQLPTKLNYKNFDRNIYQSTWQNLQENSNLEIVPLEVFTKVTSTNQMLWELMSDRLTIPQAAIALQQTAGRGQWGRQWESELGGLYLSVAIFPELELKSYPHLVMATAWGIAKTLRDRDLPIYLKWPNDLILEGRKLGGIKIETRTQQQQITKAVIGVGINWSNSTPEIGINLKSYDRHRAKSTINSLEELAALTTYGIIWGYQNYLQDGIDKLLANYLAILTSIGKEIKVGQASGTVTGVTVDGKLKVRLQVKGATSEVCFSPGEISLGYAQ
jgi:BirA family biotin operon repressor/biotin-[acetyl-CoA-carboxylase] ligase